MKPTILRRWPGSFRLLSLLVAAIASLQAQATYPPHGRDNPFDPNVKVTFTETQMLVESDGIPTHPTADYPNRDNPNPIRKQTYRFVIPLQPKPAAQKSETPMGPIGVALNGIPFYNQYNAERQDAVKLEVFDSCCGHPDMRGRYHYHKYPVCVKSPFRDPDGKHSPLIGYMFDGYPVYGPNDTDGRPPKDLDDCNGHSDPVRGYHYHVTKEFPYLIGGYHGEVDRANLDRPGGPDPNRRPPPDRRQRPPH
jgi:hypothetical protein